MALTIRDVQDAQLLGQANKDEAMQQIAADFWRPEAELRLRIFRAMLSPAALAMIEATAPGAIEMIEKAGG